MANIKKRLLRCNQYAREANLTEQAKSSQTERKLLLDDIKAVKATNDIDKMIQAEKDILENELEEHANSPAMTSSLTAALREMEVIQKHLSIVDDPIKYSAVDSSYTLPKNRQKGLPLDEARQGFNSHFARLVNADKSRSDDIDKKIISARKTMFNTAKKLYMQKQANTLGINNQTQKRGLKL